MSEFELGGRIFSSDECDEVAQRILDTFMKEKYPELHKRYFPKGIKGIGLALQKLFLSVEKVESQLENNQHWLWRETIAFLCDQVVSYYDEANIPQILKAVVVKYAKLFPFVDVKNYFLGYASNLDEDDKDKKKLILNVLEDSSLRKEASAFNGNSQDLSSSFKD